MSENQNNLHYRCAIVDDDPQFLFILSCFINAIPKLKLCREFLNPQTAIDNILEEDEIDFLFLDIRMGNISGLDVAARLRDKVKFIVFISGSKDYALDAHAVGADHYLVKPVNFDDFLKMVNSVLHRNRRFIKTY
ncbi:two-component SAPR family response regulator [Pedobacter sp. UYEF25]